MFYCGIDIGTTNTKAIVLDDKGTLRARCLSKSTGNWFTDFSSVMDLIADSVGHEQKALGITSQGGSFVFLDEQYEPVSRFISWTELAGCQYEQKLEKHISKETFYDKTGWAPAQWLAVCKILRELENDADLKSEFSYIATVPDYIYAKLCGKFVTDITNAQITGLFDFQKGVYYRDALNWGRISLKNLPSVKSSPGVIAENIPTKWGDIILTTSSHDQYAAMEAVDLEPDKDIMLATGTAWVFNIKSREPFYDYKSFYIHPGRDIYSNNFGNIVTLGPIGKKLDELLVKYNIEHKYLSDMEAEFSNNKQTDSPIEPEQWNKYSGSESQRIMAGRDYMNYAASIVGYYCDQMDISKNTGKIIMTGGAAKSSYWPKIIADMTTMDVETIDFAELTAFGAASYCQKVLGSEVISGLPESVSTEVVKPSDDSIRKWFLDKQLPVIKEELSG